MWKSNVLVVGIFCALASGSALAVEGVKIQKLLTGLTNPSGVAIRPGDTADRYEVFIADSGAGRVLRAWSNQPNESTEAISAFSITTFGGEPMKAGPIALLFLDRERLVVGVSGNNRSANLRLYHLAEKAILAEQHIQQVDVAREGAPAEETANHVYAIARTRSNDRVPDAFVLTATRNDQTARLHKVAVRADQFGKLETFAANENNFAGEFPVAAAVTQQGYVVAGHVGALDRPHDSRIVFYSPIDGTRVMDLSTNLYDIVALAYSPHTGNLYAADIAWMAPNESGIYRIDDAADRGKAACVAVKVASIAGPSAMAFGPDGALYVTAFGEPNAANPKTGSILKLTGEL